jgi:hypothetical protein
VAPLDRRAVVWALVGVAITLAITFLGSGELVWFDAALGWLPKLTLAIALVAWTATFYGLLHHAVHLRRPDSGQPPVEETRQQPVRRA